MYSHIHSNPLQHIFSSLKPNLTYINTALPIYCAADLSQTLSSYWGQTSGPHFTDIHPHGTPWGLLLHQAQQQRTHTAPSHEQLSTPSPLLSTACNHFRRLYNIQCLAIASVFPLFLGSCRRLLRRYHPTLEVPAGSVFEREPAKRTLVDGPGSKKAIKPKPTSRSTIPAIRLQGSRASSTSPKTTNTRN